MTTQLLSLLSELPTDLDALRSALEAGDFTPDALHETAMTFITDLCLSQDEALSGDDAPAEEMYCAALPQVLYLFLHHGMDPNGKTWFEGQDMVSGGGGECLLTALRPIEWGDVAAQCVQVLLEHGADPCLPLEAADDPFTALHSLIDEAICEYDGCPDSYVHQLAVMLGYGAADVALAEGAAQELLRCFRDLTWQAELSEGEDEFASPTLTLHFAHRATGNHIASF